MHFTRLVQVAIVGAFVGFMLGRYRPLQIESTAIRSLPPTAVELTTWQSQAQLRLGQLREERRQMQKELVVLSDRLRAHGVATVLRGTADDPLCLLGAVTW